MSRLIKHLFPLCGTLTVALLPRLAAAQECGADAPCAEGFECITGMTDVACPAIACAEGSDCEQPACGTPEPYSYCSQKQCDPDGAADQCGASMVCFSYEYGMCSGSAGSAPACEPGTECPEADIAPADPVESCTTQVESYCTYKHQLPCTEAADCGAGFNCVAYEITSCPGSTGGGTEPAMDGGSAPAGAEAPAAGGAPGDAPAEERPLPPEMTECTTELSEDKYCQVIDVTCEADADCEEGWTCADQYTNGGCAMTTPDDSAPAPSTDPAAPMPAEGDMAKAQAAIVVACDQPVSMEPVEKKCTPPGYYYGVAADGSVATPESGALGGSEDDFGNGTTTGGANDPNGIPAPTAPGGGMTSGPGTNTGTNANGTSGNTNSGAGCSVGHSPTHSNAGFAGLLLGLAAFALRRKR